MNLKSLLLTQSFYCGVYNRICHKSLYEITFLCLVYNIKVLETNVLHWWSGHNLFFSSCLCFNEHYFYSGKQMVNSCKEKSNFSNLKPPLVNENLCSL